MAFGDIIGSPGYRGSTSSFMGFRPPAASKPSAPTAPKKKGMTAGGLAGLFGGGLPSYKPAATRPPSISTPTIGGGGSTAALEMPKHDPYKAGTYFDPNLGAMAAYGKGLMDPTSDYYKRLSAGMQQQIGAQSAAQQRAAALRGAWGGLGGGQGGEVMRTAADIGQAGLEAQGQAEAGLRLQAPQIGAGMLQSTFAPQLGYHQLTEGSRQFGAGLGEGAHQFGVGVGLQQQQMAQQQAQQQAQFAQQSAMFNAQMQQRQREMEWQAMMQQMAQAYG